MGLVIIVAVLLLASIALFIYGKMDEWGHEDSLVFGSIGMVFFGIAFLVLLGFLCIIPAEFAWNEQQYYNLKAQVEYVEFDYSLSDNNLRNQVLEMNDDIARHRAYSHNWLVGVFYCEHLGELEPLKWRAEGKIRIEN